MEKIQFSITVEASRERVWEILWQEDNYKKWTSVFTEGSHAITDNWKEGSKVLFMDPNGNGIVSIVESNKPCTFMSFRHIGEIQNNIEDTTSDKVKEWAGSMENYSLSIENSLTRLQVEMDIAEAYKDYFLNTWPKALDKVKQLAEEK